VSTSKAKAAANTMSRDNHEGSKRRLPRLGPSFSPDFDHLHRLPGSSTIHIDSLNSSITRALNLPTTARSRLARMYHVLSADFCLHGRPSWQIGSCLCLAACTALELCSSATPPHPAAPAFFHHVFQPSRGEHFGARLTTLSQHHPPSSDTPLFPTRASIRPGGRPAGSRGPK